MYLGLATLGIEPQDLQVMSLPRYHCAKLLVGDLNDQVRARTADLRLIRPLLYHLSYMIFCW